MSIMDRLEGVISRHAELSALMATGDLDANKYANYAKEYAELSPVVERARAACATKTRASPRKDCINTRETVHSDSVILAGSAGQNVSRAVQNTQYVSRSPFVYM